MSLRIITHSGTLELGRPAPGAPPCERCAKRANVELDVVIARGPAKVVNLVRAGGRSRDTERGEPVLKRVALCTECVESLVGLEYATGKRG